MSGVNQTGVAVNGIEAGVVIIAAPAALPAAAPPAAVSPGGGPPAAPLQAAVLGHAAMEVEVPAVPAVAMADRAFYNSSGGRVYYNPPKKDGVRPLRKATVFPDLAAANAYGLANVAGKLVENQTARKTRSM